MSGHVVVTQHQFDVRRGTCDWVVVRAGRRTLVPDPLIEDAQEWHYPARVEVTVSPTGRSVQVHVNGEKVWP